MPCRQLGVGSITKQPGGRGTSPEGKGGALDAPAPALGTSRLEPGSLFSGAMILPYHRWKSAGTIAQ